MKVDTESRGESDERKWSDKQSYKVEKKSIMRDQREKIMLANRESKMRNWREKIKRERESKVRNWREKI